MSSALRVVSGDAEQTLARVILEGDLSRLTDGERVAYYRDVCASAGLNPLTRPFEYLRLQGKLILYARKDATDQLRQIHGVSVTVQSQTVEAGLAIVVARATLPNGRTDEDMGAVPLPANGEARANALLKAMTKAKRRVTLSICGLGFLDETEVEAIPDAQPVPPQGEAERIASSFGTLQAKVDGFCDQLAQFGDADDLRGWLADPKTQKARAWLREPPASYKGDRAHVAAASEIVEREIAATWARLLPESREDGADEPA